MFLPSNVFRHLRDRGTDCHCADRHSRMHAEKIAGGLLPRCTRTSSVVTPARPQASSSLKITNRSFRHASPHLWNKRPVSLRQPCLNQSSSPSSSPLSLSITPSLFHSKLKHIYSKIFSTIDTHTHQPDRLHGLLAISVFSCSTVFLF